MAKIITHRVTALDWKAILAHANPLKEDNLVLITYFFIQFLADSTTTTIYTPKHFGSASSTTRLLIGGSNLRLSSICSPSGRAGETGGKKAEDFQPGDGGQGAGEAPLQISLTIINQQATD
jgi:hypothetical protein